ARQHLRMVPRLVPGEVAGRRRSGPPRREGDRDQEPGRDRLPVTPWRRLDRRRPVLTDGVPRPVRAGAAVRPYRVSGRPGEEVEAGPADREETAHVEFRPVVPGCDPGAAPRRLLAPGAVAR